MKIENIKPFITKTTDLMIDRKTCFFILEDSPAKALDNFITKPYAINIVLEPRVDARGIMISDEEKQTNSLTTNNEVESFDWIQLNSALSKNRPIAINLNSIFSMMSRDNKKFNWSNKVVIEKINDVITKILGSIEKYSYTTVFLYSVNSRYKHPINILLSKLYPIIVDYQTGNKPFDYLAVNYIYSDNTNEIRVLNNKDVKFDFIRTRAFLSRMFSKTGKVQDKEVAVPLAVESKYINILNTAKIDTETKNLAIKALTKMEDVKASNKTKDQFIADIVSSNITKSQIESWLNENIGYKLDYSNVVVKNPINIDGVINSVNEVMSDIMTKDVDVSQLSNRRGVEMEQVFMDDIKKVVMDLENRQGKFQIKIKDIKLAQLNNSSDVRETVEDELRISYTNHAGKANILKFKIPRLINNNYFKHYGQRKALTYQIIPDIITKPKPEVVRISSNYSIVKITKKSTDTNFFYEIFIGGKKIPVSIPLLYWFGIDGLFKYLGIPYSTSKTKVSGSILINGLYYSFTPTRAIQTGIINGLAKTLNKISPEVMNNYIDKDEKKFVSNIFEYMFGNSQMKFILDSINENFVDPLTFDIAQQKNIPTEFHKMLVYAIEFLEVSEITRPTDLTQSRLRYSEVITYSIAKSLNASLNDYKSRAAVGDADAQLFIDPNIVVKTLNESTLLALIESANPIEEIQTLTRVKPMGPGGIPSKAAATLAMRNIDETHYGVIDPIDTPESDSIGISRQLVVSQDLTNSKGYFKQYSKKDRNQIFGVGSALTPYANYDDGNRLQMAANQVRQAIPIINPEQPIVQTGYETVVRTMLSDNFVKRSDYKGEVIEIVQDKLITIANEDGKEITIDISPVKLNSGTGKSSGSVFTPKVKVGDKIVKGQILAEGSHIKDGTLSMGRTLLTGVMAYGGYTFEDSLMISESLAKKEKLTSLHILEFQFFFDAKTPIEFLAEIGDVLTEGSPIAIFKKTNIEGIMMDVDPYDENDNDSVDVIDSVTHKTLLSPAGTVIDIQIYAQTEINKEYKKYQVGKIGGHVYKGQPMEKNYIVIKIKQQLPIGVGDKLCNRHGNKGIISRVVPDNLMPQWRGQPLDILYSPLSITGRMNMGQIYETYLGLCIKEMSILVIKNKDNKAKVLEIISFFYSTLDVSKDNEMSKAVIIKYKSIISNTNKYIEFIKELESGKDFSIVVPPFNEPKLKQIQTVMKKFSLNDSYKLKLPELGGIDTMGEVNIGYQTWYKLEHISENKIHARSIGTVGANLQGVAGKKRGGAAKLGELDISALISHDARVFLKESFSLSSDDHGKKTQAINDIIEKGFTNISKEPASSPTKQIMSNYLLGMQLSVEGLNEIRTIKNERE